MRRLAPLTALALLLAVPAVAHAGAVTIGSDLSARASIAQSHPRDWAAFPTAFGSGGSGVVAPVQGEVAQVTFKGTVLKASNPAYESSGHPPFNFKIAVLRPNANGTFELILASNDLPFPFGGDEQQLSTFTLIKDEPRICVQPGDIVALATSGGFGNTDPAFGGFPDNFYADGYPVQMFGSVPNSGVSVFEQGTTNGGTDDGNGFQVGDVESGTERRGQELLMRATIATGDDARPFCRSDEENQGPTVSLPNQSRELKVASQKASVQIGCVSLRPCEGMLFLKQGASTIVGEGSFSLAGRSEGAVGVSLNANGVRKLRESGGRLSVTTIVRPAGGAKLEEGGFELVGEGGGPTSSASLAMPVKPKVSLAVRKGAVALKVRCEGPGNCAGRLALAKQGTLFGSAAFSVPAGSARTVTVKLNAKAKRALRQAKGPAIAVKATTKSAAGARSVFFKIKRA
ncbi:MAG: hypothetical protein WKF94_03750 [Solirubrobacteraceae bacterium]